MFNTLLKKGQNWSLDLILGIVIFMLILSIFYMVLSSNSGGDVSLLKSKGTNILNKFDSDKTNNLFSLIEGNKINMSKIEDLYLNGNYKELKKELGITDEFCIVLEDSNGRIITIEDAGNNYYYGFGNSDINISGCPCGTPCS